MLKRIGLFLFTNLLVMVTISIVINLLGIKPYLDSQGIHYDQLAAFCLVWGMGGAFISLQLSRWMAKMSMGIQVLERGNAGQYEGLVEMVAQLARAAGLPKTPEVGIYESPEVNAFATGPSKSRSLVAFSTGLLNGMRRDEIEGVAAHEIAHIANGDMVTMTLLQGVLNAFVMFIARVVGYAVGQALASRDEREGSSNATAHIASTVVVLVLDIVLGILASIVVFWYSRQREFKADSGAAKYAGREKMIAALQRLASTHGIIDDRQPAAAATMKISGHPSGLGRLFMSHPPLEERIAALRSMRTA